MFTDYSTNNNSHHSVRHNAMGYIIHRKKIVPAFALFTTCLTRPHLISFSKIPTFISFLFEPAFVLSVPVPGCHFSFQSQPNSTFFPPKSAVERRSIPNIGRGFHLSSLSTSFDGLFATTAFKNLHKFHLSSSATTEIHRKHPNRIDQNQLCSFRFTHSIQAINFMHLTHHSNCLMSQ